MARDLNPTGIHLNDKQGLSFPLMNGDVEVADLRPGHVAGSVNEDYSTLTFWVLATTGTLYKGTVLLTEA
jgi:hypothetical protein